ncbi:MAG TPA: hypothetical protein VIT22_02595 [Pseudoxanthomonas sp.]
MGDIDGNAGRRQEGWRLRVALLAFALAASAAPACAQTVDDNFDRVNGERTIAYTADGSMDLTRPVLTFNASWAGGAPSAAIRLAFVSASESRFAACHGIEWFVDGQPLRAGSASYRGRVVDGEMIELIDQHVTTSWVATISTAQAVRYRVCRNEYAFTPNDIHAFGRIAAKLKSAMPPPSAARASVPAPAPATEVEYKGMNWRPQQESLFPSRN